ncbi:MAG TPA: helix-turn-helix domain-containing protein [Candidatus Hydrogenedentes bacterium]|nr:helix-turn-helix domain-containing protein [Candidatus Hydrogenedentota bacterium]
MNEAENRMKRGKVDFLKVDGVAEMLDCSVRSVYRLADAGKLPRPVRLGGMVRWNSADLEAWVAGGCRPVR